MEAWASCPRRMVSGQHHPHLVNIIPILQGLGSAHPTFCASESLALSIRHVSAPSLRRALTHCYNFEPSFFGRPPDLPCSSSLPCHLVVRCHWAAGDVRLSNFMVEVTPSGNSHVYLIGEEVTFGLGNDRRVNRGVRGAWLCATDKGTQKANKRWASLVAPMFMSDMRTASLTFLGSQSQVAGSGNGFCAAGLKPARSLYLLPLADFGQASLSCSVEEMEFEEALLCCQFEQAPELADLRCALDEPASLPKAL